MNGWGRVPDTLRARVQVENFLHPIGGVSWVTVYRLARQMEVFGIERRDVYWEMQRLGWPNLSSLVMREMASRESRAATTKPVFRLMHDGSLQPTGQLREVRP